MMTSQKAPDPTSNASALDLFKMGFDTLWIAKYFGIHEGEAEKRVTIERSAAKGLPNPYEHT